MKPKVGDKIKVKTKIDGVKLCIIDSINDKYIHFKNMNKFGLEVNIDRVTHISKPWRGANFEYNSIN